MTKIDTAAAALGTGFSGRLIHPGDGGLPGS